MNATAITVDNLTTVPSEPMTKKSLIQMADELLHSEDCRLDGRPFGTASRSVGLMFTPMGGKVRRK
jgi:hypothetical protein